MAPFILLGLLFASMICDLREHQVPMPLTLLGLICSGIYAVFNGVWAPVLLIVTLIIISDFQPREMRLPSIFVFGVVAIFLQPWSALISALILGAWLMWEFELMGGGDVKLIMTAALVLGSPWIIVPITLAGGIQGGIALFRKKNTIPFVVSIFTGTLIFVLYPFMFQQLWKS